MAKLQQRRSSGTDDRLETLKKVTSAAAKVADSDRFVVEVSASLTISRRGADGKFTSMTGRAGIGSVQVTTETVTTGFDTLWSLTHEQVQLALKAMVDHL